jgi:hypothetical protein
MVFQPNAFMGNVLLWAQSASAVVLPTAGKLLAIVVAGGFGGGIYAIASLLEGGKESDAWKATKGCSVSLYMAGQAAIGVGGAFAALFGIFTLGNTVHTSSANDLTENPIYFVSLCVVGGYIGNTLLVAVGKKLAKQLADLEEKQKVLESKQTTLAEKSATAIDAAMDTARKAETRAGIAESTVNQAKDMLVNVFIARDLAEKLEKIRESKSQIPEDLRTESEAARAKLDGYRDAFPTTRILFIVSANLAFALDHADDAFAKLNEFIANRKRERIESDDDVSAWYNIACYYAVLSTSSAKSRGYTGDESAESLQEKSLEALGECLQAARRCGPEQLSQRLAKIKGDPDLPAIRSLDAYKQLMGLYAGGNGA